VLVACGGNENRGVDICANQIPPPAACMTECDPAPGAPTTCPGGFHCTPDGFCNAQCTIGGGECGDGYRCTPDGQCVGEDDCIGLECDIVDCTSMGQPPTTITGTVFAPNGTLPLSGIDVFIPNTPLAPPVEGAICDRCGTTLPGFPIVKTVTDAMGNFTLENAPVGANIEVVISTGKWRRTVTIPSVSQCANTSLGAAETRLPKNQSEGSMPKIAISTGSADALECLVRKLGIDDAEIGSTGDPGRLHLYTDGGAGGGEGTNSFQNGFPGGNGNFADSDTLWNDVATLSQYDIAIFSCEGAQHPETKSQQSMDAVKAYADLGGRVFLSHWHNIWVEGATQDAQPQNPGIWTSVATWNDSQTTFTNPPDTIDEVNNPKGTVFADWMLNVGGSPSRAVIPIEDSTGKQTCTGVDNARAERWVYWNNNGQEFPQMFQFTTPQENQPNDRCGKVVFSDMHVSGDSDSAPGTPYPTGCSNDDLTPQEKALAFMFFDIASCVAAPIF
jgi:hypothetical protein